MYTMGKNIREGDRYEGHTVLKVTPAFHSVLLWLEDQAEPIRVGDQDWHHIERNES